MENKKKMSLILLSIVCLLIIIGVALIFFDVKENSIDKTEKIIVEKLFGEYDTKEITNAEYIDKIIKIINNRTPINEDETVPYNLFPRYRLKMLDKKDESILTINFYDYSNEGEYYGYISIDDTSYNIDIKALLEIINY